MDSKELEGLLNSPRIRSINSFVNELHDSVTEIYEALIDDEDKEASQLVNKMIEQLKQLKLE